MEVTTVSPSPASPTEGDDVCDIDVTDVAIHSVALLICLCGLAGNGAVLCLLSLKSRNAGFFGLAVTDFVFLLFAVPSALLILVEDVSCSPILPLRYMNFVFQLSVVSCYFALYFVTDSNVQYMRNICKLCCRCDLPEYPLWVQHTVQYGVFLALCTVIFMVTYLCPSHQQEHCGVALICMNTLFLLLFAAPVVISSTIDFINARRGSQQQQPKTRDIVIFIIVLFTLILILWNFLQQFGYIPVPSQVVFLLACINSSIKPFIYFLVGRCWKPCSVQSLRLSLQRVFEEKKKKTTSRNDAKTDTAV